jgi:hypothetical protein
VGWFILKEEMSGLFNYAEQKIAILKFWLDVLGEMMGVEGGLVALKSLLTLNIV